MRKESLIKVLVFCCLSCVLSPAYAESSDFFGDSSLHSVEEEIVQIGRRYSQSTDNKESEQLNKRAALLVSGINDPMSLARLALWAMSNRGRGADCSPMIINIVLYDSIARLGDIGGKDATEALLYIRKRVTMDGGLSLTYGESYCRASGRRPSHRHSIVLEILDEKFRLPARSATVAEYEADCNVLLWNLWNPLSTLHFEAKDARVFITFNINRDGRATIIDSKVNLDDPRMNTVRKWAADTLKAASFPSPSKCGLSSIKAKVQFAY